MCERHGVGEECSGELIVPWGECHLDVVRGASVHLCGSTGAGPGASAQPLKVDLKETVCGKAVEVVGGYPALQLGGVGSLVTADPVTGCNDLVVHRPAVGVARGADRGQRILG